MTWTRYGLILLAGLAGSACSQEAREPVKVGTAQVELRSDLVLPETPGSSTALLDGDNPDHPGSSTNPMPASQGAVKRYKFPSVYREDSTTRKSSVRENYTRTQSWTLADKHWVRGGKGFGVAAEDMVPLGTVQLDHASYYFSTVALKPHSKVSEPLAQMPRPFKSRKPLVFHSGATGFAHEPPADAALPRHSPAVEVRPTLSPIPETRVSFKPKTQVTLVPAKNRLDLINGNQNLNRHRFYGRDSGAK